MTYELSGQSILKEKDEKINEKIYYQTFFLLNELETDTVRLSASTIQQLFKDTNYNLE